uniref:Uncharacterized protein n=1 Tax=Ascaris lumbricoides TaxID=6252 RepID=A0A0M3I2Q6_ASCLU
MKQQQNCLRTIRRLHYQQLFGSFFATLIRRKKLT